MEATSGTVSLTQNVPWPSARKGGSSVELSRETYPVWFLVNPEPSTLIVVPETVEVGDATIWGDGAAAPAGVTNAVATRAATSRPIKAIVSRRRAPRPLNATLRVSPPKMALPFRSIVLD